MCQSTFFDDLETEQVDLEDTRSNYAYGNIDFSANRVIVGTIGFSRYPGLRSGSRCTVTIPKPVTVFLGPPV